MSFFESFARKLLFVILVFIPIKGLANAYYVGESFYLSLPSVNGTIDAAAWYCDEDGYFFDFSETTYGCTVRVAQYFTGERTIVCQYAYRTYSGSYSSGRAYYYISCKPSTLTINKQEITLKLGQTAKVSYSNSSGFTPATVIWETSNWRVADIDGTQKVYDKKTVTIEGNKVGECTISCKGFTGGEDAKCVVKVVSNPATSISVEPESLVCAEGTSAKITLKYEPNDAVPSYSWQSSNEAIATVSSTGLVKGISEGSAVISVTTDNGLSASCIVDVIPQPQNISLEDNYCWTQGYFYHLNPDVEPYNAYRSFKWETDSPDILLVSESGDVKAIKEGSANITVTSKNGLSASAVVTVRTVDADMDYRNVISKINQLSPYLNQVIINLRKYEPNKE